MLKRESALAGSLSVPRFDFIEDLDRRLSFESARTGPKFLDALDFHTEWTVNVLFRCNHVADAQANQVCRTNRTLRQGYDELNARTIEPLRDGGSDRLHLWGQLTHQFSLSHVSTPVFLDVQAEYISRANFADVASS